MWFKRIFSFDHGKGYSRYKGFQGKGRGGSTPICGQHYAQGRVSCCSCCSQHIRPGRSSTPQRLPHPGSPGSAGLWWRHPPRRNTRLSGDADAPWKCVPQMCERRSKPRRPRMMAELQVPRCGSSRFCLTTKDSHLEMSSPSPRIDVGGVTLRPPDALSHSASTPQPNPPRTTTKALTQAMFPGRGLLHDLRLPLSRLRRQSQPPPRYPSPQPGLDQAQTKQPRGNSKP